MHRALLFAVLTWLLAVVPIVPVTAYAQGASSQSQMTRSFPVDVLPEPVPPAPTGWNTVVSTDTIVHAAGGLLGIVAFNFYVAPLYAVSGVGVASVQSLIASRIAATTLAATGAVVTTYFYDRLTEQPIDYTYFWSRSGAVAGVGAGTAWLAAMGYRASTAFPRFSPPWVANRAFLVGAGLAGAWLTDTWMRRDQPAKRP